MEGKTKRQLATLLFFVLFIGLIPFLSGQDQEGTSSSESLSLSASPLAPCGIVLQGSGGHELLLLAPRVLMGENSPLASPIRCSFVTRAVEALPYRGRRLGLVLGDPRAPSSTPELT